MNKTYKSIFLTFEEIEQGYNVFTESFYKGRDEEGEAIYGERLALDIVIDHNNYYPLIKSVKIMRNRAKTKRLHFVVKMYDNVTYTFPYSKDGWNSTILKIKEKMKYVRKLTELIMNEERL